MNKRKILLILLLIVASLVSYSQSGERYHKFMGRVNKDIYKTNDTVFIEFRDSGKTNFWIPRPKMFISGMEIPIKGEGSSVKTLSGMGFGVSYAGFTEQNGLPYQYLSADLMLILGTKVNDQQPLAVSIAGSVTVWQYLSFGAGYNFKEKYPFILTGVSYSFN